MNVGFVALGRVQRVGEDDAAAARGSGYFLVKSKEM